MRMPWAILMYSANPTTCLPTKPFRAYRVQAGLHWVVRVILYPPADLAAVPDREAEDISEELELLDNALDAVRQEIQALV